ncbi:MAG: branched-chain amino acid--2-keto-4-methylthiobutyrate aminotransferase [Boseongicola sp. SB0662_bin_57]|nr:branched-chain amino acid--2-keto-4-methylthiobutyrate aminotransferase [Boseongicola sp. SB0662_bin_57]
MNGPSPLAVQDIMTNDPVHAPMERAQEWAAGAAYVIDRFVPLGEAAVPITDLGLVRADAVYDVVSVSRGQFFRLEDHQARFARSCDRMKLSNRFTQAEEAELLNELVARTGLKDAYAWWAITRGTNLPHPSDRLHAERFKNRFYAFVIPYVFIKDDADRQAGIRLHVSKDYVRIPANAVDPRAKNFCSLDLNMSLMEAGRAGAEWSVLTDGNGVLTEAPGSNIFVVRENKITTPETGCLEGITRLTALDLCAEIGLNVEVGTVTVDDLMAADEAFLTSSAGGIIPISAVNQQPICRGSGPVSTRIHNLYWEKRWAGWHGTPVDYEAVN